MGIGTDLIRFFERTNGYQVLGDYRPRSLKEFIQKHPEHVGWNLYPAIQKLVHQGYLIELDDENIFLEAHSWHNRRYFSQLDVEEDLAYGTFDFFVLGFPYIRTYFAPAVKAVYVKWDGKEDICSGFVLEDHRFVTAFHCIEEKSDVQIDGWDKVNGPLQNIWVPADKEIDLCVLEFQGDPFPGVSGFRLQEALILDEVMTLGYPNISGYVPTLAAERTQVAGRLQAALGAVVGQMTAYWQNQPHWLLSTLIKSGSSGGPVVGIEGKVIGVITHIPTDLTGEPLLGYGGAIPTATLEKLLQARTDKSEYVQCASKQDAETGFKHVRRL